jgi:hypothetical protein
MEIWECVKGMNQQIENLMASWHLLWIRSADLQTKNNKTHQSLDVVIVNLEHWPVVIYEDNNEESIFWWYFVLLNTRKIKMDLQLLLQPDIAGPWSTERSRSGIRHGNGRNGGMWKRNALMMLTSYELKVLMTDEMCKSSMYIFAFFQVMRWIVPFISPNCSLPLYNKNIAV